jgi:hypothetical protein
MENHYFWAFFIIALIAGASIALAMSNSAMTGYFALQFPWATTIAKNVTNKTCTDSDGGKNYYVKGFTQIGQNTWTDTCQTANSVNENYCLNNLAHTEIFDCPQGCKDGACVRTSFCGDGVCNTEVGENEINCPQDCKSDCSNCQNVLDMLNKCKNYGGTLGTNQSCNDICANPKLWGQSGPSGTCILAQFKSTDPYYSGELVKCDFKEKGREINCICCSP